MKKLRYKNVLQWANCKILMLWSTILYQIPPSIMIHSILDSRFAQPLSLSTVLIYLLVWNPPLHTPYISSPNHCLLFATHALTIATSFAVVLRLCHLFLVSLQLLTCNFIFYPTASIWPFSSLPAEVPPHSLSLQAKSHFRVVYYFAHNCCTVSLS